MECKMIAVVQPTEGVAVAVDNTFKTINFVRKRALLVDEIRLSSPASPGVQGQSLLLVHEADAAAGGDAATVWIARHEGPQRQNEKKLAAYGNVTCRPVMAAQCMGTRAEVLQFWHALGFSTVYEITKTGNEYWCQSLGVDVRVQYTQLTTGRDAEVSATVAAGLKQTLLVEVSAPATDRDFVHVCRALSEFAEGLKPLVQLTNASVSAHLWKLNKKV